MKSTHYRLQRQRSGVLAVHSTDYAETMHPGAGPWAEAMGLYVQASGLATLLAEPGPGSRVVFDVGLGAAANALAAMTCHEELRRRGRRPRSLLLVSFESDLGGARFALDEAEALRYPRGHEATLRGLLDAGRVELPGGITWELRLGDFTRLIGEEPARADVIFFDPFSPRANPEMWRLSTLEALYRCRRRGGPARLVTYSSAFSTRTGLLLAGFFVGEGPRHGPQRGATAAAGDFGDLERPLTPGWLARWRRDRTPWPPFTPPTAHAPLREQLLEHPQWAHFAPEARAEGPRRAPPWRTTGARAAARPNTAKPPARKPRRDAPGSPGEPSPRPNARPVHGEGRRRPARGAAPRPRRGR